MGGPVDVHGFGFLEVGGTTISIELGSRLL